MAPYTLQSPLSAGLAAASGVMAGQQAKKDKEAALKRQAMLDAQAQADTQARLGMERSNQEATQQSRKVAQEQGAERLRNEQTRLGIEQQNAARAQAMAEAEAQKQKLLDTFKGEQREFFSHEMELSPDPVKRLGQLQKRYDIERGKGYDTKSTEAQMNKAATEIEQARRQADLEKQRGVQNANAAQRIQISIDRGDRAGAPRPETPHEKFMEDLETKRFNAEYPGGKKPAKPEQTTKPRSLSSSEQREFSKAISRLPKPDPGGAALQALAKQWNMPLDQAASYVP